MNQTDIITLIVNRMAKRAVRKVTCNIIKDMRSVSDMDKRTMFLIWIYADNYLDRMLKEST